MSEAERSPGDDGARARTIERVAVLAEAKAIEEAGGDWRIRHVCAVLDCHRSSLYREPWLRARMIHGPGGVTIAPRDVRLYQQLHTGAALRRAASDR